MRLSRLIDKKSLTFLSISFIILALLGNNMKRRGRKSKKLKSSSKKTEEDPSRIYIYLK